jgi:hypothetical protein
MTELRWGESTISLHGCSADRPHHQNNNNNNNNNNNVKLTTHLHVLSRLSMNGVITPPYLFFGSTTETVHKNELIVK